MTETAAPSRTFNIATSILLFIIAVTLWQVYDWIVVYISPSSQIIYVLYLAVPAIGIAVFFLFAKLAKSTLRKQGYKKPTTVKTSTCLLLSVAFITIYVLIYLFPAYPSGFYYQGISMDPVLILHRIASAILVSLSTESIFRGYIFRNLLRNYSFFKSLYASSILFGFYSLLAQVSIIDLIGSSLNDIVIDMFMYVLPFFAAGLFLGFFFYKTGWSLLGAVTFRAGIIFYLSPLPIVSYASEPAWWLALTLEMIAYVVLIFAVDSMIKEPGYLKRRYGLED
jgi:membrane protease YdiL (CAAX protease family)